MRSCIVLFLFLVQCKILHGMENRKSCFKVEKALMGSTRQERNVQFQDNDFCQQRLHLATAWSDGCSVQQLLHRLPHMLVALNSPCIGLACNKETLLAELLRRRSDIIRCDQVGDEYYDMLLRYYLIHGSCPFIRSMEYKKVAARSYDNKDKACVAASGPVSPCMFAALQGDLGAVQEIVSRFPCESLSHFDPVEGTMFHAAASNFMAASTLLFLLSKLRNPTILNTVNKAGETVFDCFIRAYSPFMQSRVHTKLIQSVGEKNFLLLERLFNELDVTSNCCFDVTLWCHIVDVGSWLTVRTLFCNVVRRGCGFYFIKAAKKRITSQDRWGVVISCLKDMSEQPSRYLLENKEHLLLFDKRRLQLWSD